LPLLTLTEALGGVLEAEVGVGSNSSCFIFETCVSSAGRVFHDVAVFLHVIDEVCARVSSG